MNAALLLEHYAQIADAPDAIARLRRFVLDLAVRGKITDYSPVPTEIAKLGDLATFIMGQAPPGNATNTTREGTVFVKVGEFGPLFPDEVVWTTQPLKFAQVGDVLICVVGATIGKLNLAIDCAIGRSVAAIRPREQLEQRYLYYSLMPFTLRLREGARGTAQGVISRPDLAEIQLWCPPLAEQHRIVAKVDELMALCDQLETAQAEREMGGDKLTLSTLAKLNEPHPETFADDARFALEHLEPLTKRTDQIKQLRKTILNLAVRGKLVEQDPSDEPASELLKRIAAEKARLVTAGEIKASKLNESSRSATSALPLGWVKAPLDAIAACLDFRRKPINGTERDKRIEGKALDELFPYFGATQQQGWIDDFLFDDELVLLGEDGIPFFDPLRAKAYLISGKTWVNNHAHVFKGILISNKFLVHALNVFDYTGRVVGATRAKLNQAQAIDIPIDLPPLAEQHRIVAKVDELMALCDQLEASLVEGEQTRSKLLEAVLHEALEPA